MNPYKTLQIQGMAPPICLSCAISSELSFSWIIFSVILGYLTDEDNEIHMFSIPSNRHPDHQEACATFCQRCFASLYNCVTFCKSIYFHQQTFVSRVRLRWEVRSNEARRTETGGRREAHCDEENAGNTRNAPLYNNDGWVLKAVRENIFWSEQLNYQDALELDYFWKISTRCFSLLIKNLCCKYYCAVQYLLFFSKLFI